MALQKKEEDRKSNKKEKKTECDMSAIQCFQCGKKEHFQSKCPKAKSKKGTAKQLEKETNMVLMTVEGEKQPTMTYG